MLQFIALEASVILLYSPNTVESKLYSTIGFDFFFIFNISCGLRPSAFGLNILLKFYLLTVPFV